MAQAAHRQQGERMTADEFFARRGEFEHSELVDGEVMEVSPTGFPHGRAESRLVQLLLNHVDAVGQGVVAGGEVGYQLGPNDVRGADAVVHLAEPEAGEGWMRTPPDLVVEVVSPNDTWPEIDRKADEWLAFGAREVWIADPQRRAVTIRRPGNEVVRFSGEDVLTSPVLPGFAAPLPRIFR